MPKVIYLYLILLVFLVVSGCQPVTLHRSEEGMPLPVTVRVDDVAYWLEEWRRIIELPDDKLQLALQTRESEFARADDVRSRLRLALLLAAGPASVRDQERASNLLNKKEFEEVDESARALATLLEQMIAEQKWSGDKITELRTHLKESEDRIGELEQQLQELKDIEKTIQKRN